MVVNAPQDEPDLFVQEKIRYSIDLPSAYYKRLCQESLKRAGRRASLRSIILEALDKHLPAR